MIVDTDPVVDSPPPRLLLACPCLADKCRRGLNITSGLRPAKRPSRVRDGPAPTGPRKPRHPPDRPAGKRLEESGARILLNTEVENITGFVGNFEVALKGETEEVMPAGAIILAVGADLHHPRGEYGYGKLSNVITSGELERAFFEDEAGVTVDGRRPKSA